MIQAFQAAIFDFDGLLVNSSALWDRAFRGAAAASGWELDDQQRARLVGQSTQGGAVAIAGWFGQPAQVATLERHIHEQLFALVTANAPALMPGAADLVAAAHGRYPLAIASNSPADVLDAALSAAGILAAFDAVIAAGGAVRPKPLPDPYTAASAAVGVAPRDAVALEDSRLGAQAAQAAGLSLVIVTDASWPDETPAPPSESGRPALRVASLADAAVRQYLLGE